jgi:hypothetical protein
MQAMVFGGLALRRRPVASGGAPTPISLTDNFNDASKAAAWATNAEAPQFYGIGGYALGGTNPPTEASGYIEVGGFSASTQQFNGYTSNSTVNMATGQSVWVKCTPTGNITAVLGFQSGTSLFCRIQIDSLNGNIAADNWNAGSGTTFWGSGASVPYDSTNHAWIRITNNGSAFDVYTAPDSSGAPGTWTLRGTSTTAYGTPSAVNVGLWAVANNATPGSVRFDGFCTNT